ncbi:hypothetical protein HYDPIDRAFT_33437 [Hydnomerulius pinastri MD-312]|uniref:NADH:ubiquinone reductase (non-electrogenic) n=1 Tax=Hydnomerulius pinastri MD-312 TaxID=994086 RepID=A0A0C9W8Y7_9AGAM|nr:hypothetical protein HYDPIDRAFT_33437 [Hydnomerulius pinastri MD-312]
MKPLHTRNPSAPEATRKSQRPQEDLTDWYPEPHPYMLLTLVEALPSVPPMFHQELIQYTERTFKENRDDDWDHGVMPSSVHLKPKDAPEEEVDSGLVVWAAGNTLRKLARDLMGGVREQITSRYWAVPSIFAIGDCTSTSYAPTAQVASLQGAYLTPMLQVDAVFDLMQPTRSPPINSPPPFPPSLPSISLYFIRSFLSSLSLGPPLLGRQDNAHNISLIPSTITHILHVSRFLHPILDV